MSKKAIAIIGVCATIVATTVAVLTYTGHIAKFILTEDDFECDYDDEDVEEF